MGKEKSRTWTKIKVAFVLIGLLVVGGPLLFHYLGDQHVAYATPANTKQAQGKHYFSNCCIWCKIKT